jgi:hypothetical protein
VTPNRSETARVTAADGAGTKARIKARMSLGRDTTTTVKASPPIVKSPFDNQGVKAPSGP